MQAHYNLRKLPTQLINRSLNSLVITPLHPCKFHCIFQPDQQQQQQFNQQPTYSHTQNPYSTQPYPYVNQPPMVYVQPRPPQQSSSRDESSCLACAWSVSIDKFFWLRMISNVFFVLCGRRIQSCCLLLGHVLLAVHMLLMILPSSILHVISASDLYSNLQYTYTL